MTTATPGRPDTALGLLTGAGGPGSAELRAQFGGQLGGALDGLPALVREVAAGKAADAAAQLLDVSLIEVLIGAWREHEQLTAAARRSLRAPGSTQLPGLLTFQVSATQNPYIDILVDHRRVTRIQLTLALDYEVRALLPEVRAGVLTAVRYGHCEVTASLAIDGQPVASQSMEFELPGAISLGRGLRLLPAGEYAGATPGPPAPGPPAPGPATPAIVQEA